MATVVPPPQLHDVGASVMQGFQIGIGIRNQKLDERKQLLAEQLAKSQQTLLVAQTNNVNTQTELTKIQMGIIGPQAAAELGKTKAATAETRQRTKGLKMNRKQSAELFSSNLQALEADRALTLAQADHTRNQSALVQHEIDTDNLNLQMGNLTNQFNIADVTGKKYEVNAQNAYAMGDQEAGDKWTTLAQAAFGAGSEVIMAQGQLTGSDPKVVNSMAGVYGSTMISQMQTQPTALQVAKAQAITQTGAGGESQGEALASIFNDPALGLLEDRPASTTSISVGSREISDLSKIEGIEDKDVRQEAKAIFLEQKTGEPHALIPSHKRGKAGKLKGEPDFDEALISISEYQQEALRLQTELDEETDDKKKDALQKNLDKWLSFATKFERDRD